jgi:hypothetical protein
MFSACASTVRGATEGAWQWPIDQPGHLELAGVAQYRILGLTRPGCYSNSPESPVNNGLLVPAENPRLCNTFFNAFQTVIGVPGGQKLIMS